MKKLFLAAVIAVAVLALAVPAFAVLDDNSTNQTNSQIANGGNSTATGGNSTATGGSSVSTATGGAGGRADSSILASGNSSNDNRNANTQNFSPRNTNVNKTNSRSSSNQHQGQGQNQTANGTVSVSGDTEKHVMGEGLYLAAPNTVAGAGQQASSVYSVFGGVNMTQTQEYQVCREKIDVITSMRTAGYLTADEATAEAKAAWAQLKDNTQPKRFLWIGPKTRGVSGGNLFGIVACDGCNEFNTDNWMGLKPVIDAAAAKVALKK